MRPTYWKLLIKEIREVYDGKLTYAANWDNYQNVPFWKELDYIGVDAYFPLSDAEVPTEGQLTKGWMGVKKQLKHFTDSCGKELLFTEYGYRNIPYTARGNWKNKDVLGLNQEAQSNAYHALYQNWWNEKNFAGGFL